MLSYTQEELELAVKESFSYSQVLRKLKLSITGASHRLIKKRIQKLNLDISHFCRKKSYPDHKRKTYTDVLINNPLATSRISGRVLTKRLIESGRNYSCSICKNTGEWLDKPITLEVDHIDGDWKNNSVENLRFLCPNCHSQTSNFTNKKINKYCSCGNIIKTKQAKTCIKCFKRCGSQKNRPYYRTTKKPSKEELQDLLWKMPTTHIAKRYNVSDSAVGKWCKIYNIDKPPRGYWSKKK